jgi:hypothetical protein
VSKPTSRELLGDLGGKKTWSPEQGEQGISNRSDDESELVPPGDEADDEVCSKVAPTTRTTTSRLKGKGDRVEPKSEEMMRFIRLIASVASSSIPVRRNRSRPRARTPNRIGVRGTVGRGRGAARVRDD